MQSTPPRGRANRARGKAWATRHPTRLTRFYGGGGVSSDSPLMLAAGPGKAAQAEHGNGAEATQAVGGVQHKEGNTKHA